MALIVWKDGDCSAYQLSATWTYTCFISCEGAVTECSLHIVCTDLMNLSNDLSNDNLNSALPINEPPCSEYSSDITKTPAEYLHAVATSNKNHTRIRKSQYRILSFVAFENCSWNVVRQRMGSLNGHKVCSDRPNNSHCLCHGTMPWLLLWLHSATSVKDLNWELCRKHQ